MLITRTASERPRGECFRGARVSLGGERFKLCLAVHASWIAIRNRGLQESLSEVLELMMSFDDPTENDNRRRIGRARLDSLLERISNRLIGREDDLWAIHRMIEGGSRLITLTGPSGIGKTRMALEVARHCLWTSHLSFSGGVWLLDLGSTQSLNDMIQATTNSLDIQLSTYSGIELALRQVGWSLAGRGHCLIILDAVEQIVATIGRALRTWLELTEEMFFIVTSRYPTNLPEEALYRVRPLTTPSPNQHEFAGTLAKVSSVELFVDRLRVTRGDFRPNHVQLRRIAELTNLLEGNPLAIELVAASMGDLSIEDLLETIEPYLARSRQPRVDQLSSNVMTGVLEWTWQRFSREERSRLAQLTVFSGGFDMEAADAVVEIEDLPHTAEENSESIKRAITQNLIIPCLDTVEGWGRYQIVPIISRFLARQEPASLEIRSARERQASFFAQRARAWLSASHFKGRTTERHLLAGEYANFRQIVESILGPSADFERSPSQVVLHALPPAELTLDEPENEEIHTDWLLANTLALDPTHLAQSPLGSYLAIVEQTLNLANSDPTASPYLRGWLLIVKGRVLRCLNRFKASLTTLREACSLVSSSKHPQLEAIGLTELARTQVKLGMWPDAISACEEGMHRAATAQEPVLRAKACHVKGEIHHSLEQYSEAGQCYHAALRMLRRWGGREEMGRIMVNLGRIYAVMGKYKDSLTLHSQALEIFHETGDLALEAIALSSLGQTHLDYLELEAARKDISRAVQLARVAGSTHSAIRNYLNLAQEAFIKGKLSEAKRQLDGACQVQQIVGSDDLFRQNCLSTKALIAWEQDDLDEALVHLDAACQTNQFDRQRSAVRAIALAQRGALEAALDRTLEARDTFREAAQLLSGKGANWATKTVNLYEGFLDLACLQRLSESDKEERQAILGRLLERLAPARRSLGLDYDERHGGRRSRPVSLEFLVAALHLLRYCPSEPVFNAYHEASDGNGFPLTTRLG